MAFVVLHSTSSSCAIYRNSILIQQKPHIYPYIQSKKTPYLLHRPVGPLPDSLTAVRGPHSIIKCLGQPLLHRVLNLEDSVLEVFV
jgi:hypothetical protein